MVSSCAANLVLFPCSCNPLMFVTQNLMQNESDKCSLPVASCKYYNVSTQELMSTSRMLRATTKMSHHDYVHHSFSMIQNPTVNVKLFIQMHMQWLYQLLYVCSDWFMGNAAHCVSMILVVVHLWVMNRD